MSDLEILQTTRQFWESEAEAFDNEPDHGLRDPTVYEAWYNLLAQWLPQVPKQSPKKILDIGCGTGSLTLISAMLGYEATGIDLSPAMLAQAQAKAMAAGKQIIFQQMDASNPQLPIQHFDVLLCRHMLWALPKPAQVLQRWGELLAPGGRLILIEGFWHTGAGLHAQETLDVLPWSFCNIIVQNLSIVPKLWGGEVSDERYMVIADQKQRSTHVTAAV